MKKQFILFLSLLSAGCASNPTSSLKEENNVEIHLSKEMLESLGTDAETYISSITESDEDLFESIENDDGDVTLIMTPENNETYLEAFSDMITEISMQYIYDDENYSISDITYNADHTEVTIQEDGSEAGTYDSLVAVPCAMYAELYQILSGRDEEDIEIHVEIVSVEGTVLDEITYPTDLESE